MGAMADRDSLTPNISMKNSNDLKKKMRF